MNTGGSAESPQQKTGPAARKADVRIFRKMTEKEEEIR